MKDLIVEQIERRARVWQRYKGEVTGVNKRAAEDREKVNAEVHYRIEMVAYRDKLDLDKPADRVAEQTKVFAEDPRLYKRYADANTVRVGTVSLTD
jgi:hypothetical protein